MLSKPTFFALIAALPLCGCAGLKFNQTTSNDAFTYYEPAPFLAVKQAADCSYTIDVVTLPGRKRSVGFKSGLGSSKLSVKVANGIITDIGQETDTKVPETITALAGLAKQVGVGAALVAPAATTCTPSVKLHAISTAADGSIVVADAPSFNQ